MTYPQGQPPGPPQAPPPPPSNFTPSDETGSLVRFAIHGYDAHAVTPWGERPEAVVDVDVLQSSNGTAGQHYGPQRLSGKFLAPQLGQCVGREVYGRMEARPGRNQNPGMFLGALRPGDDQIIGSWLQAIQGRVVQPDPARVALAPQQESAGQGGGGYDPWASPPPQAQHQQPQYGGQPPANPWGGQPAGATGAPPPAYPPGQPPNGAPMSPQGPPQPSPAYTPPTWGGQPQASGQQPPQAPPPDDPPF